ncbi:MAG: hypothetical protein ACLGG6_05965, partial [Gammaproteobacteria bacterium]
FACPGEFRPPPVPARYPARCPSGARRDRASCSMARAKLKGTSINCHRESEATWRSRKIVDTSAILDCLATLAMTEIEFKEVP